MGQVQQAMHQSFAKKPATVGDKKTWKIFQVEHARLEKLAEQALDKRNPSGTGSLVSAKKQKGRATHTRTLKVDVQWCSEKCSVVTLKVNAGKRVTLQG